MPHTTFVHIAVFFSKSFGRPLKKDGKVSWSSAKIHSHLSFSLFSPSGCFRDKNATKTEQRQMHNSVIPTLNHWPPAGTSQPPPPCRRQRTGKRRFAPRWPPRPPAWRSAGPYLKRQTDRESRAGSKKRLLLPFSHSQCQSRRISIKRSCYIIRAVRRLRQQLVCAAIFAHASAKLSRTAFYGARGKKCWILLLVLRKTPRCTSLLEKKKKHCLFTFLAFQCNLISEKQNRKHLQMMWMWEWVSKSKKTQTKKTDLAWTFLDK